MANSPEYQTIIQLTPKLTNAFKSDLVSLSDEFLSAGFIAADNADNLRNEHNGAQGRAANLVSWIRDKIELEPERNYRAFIDVLKQRLIVHKSILRRLDEMYKKLGGTVETAALDSSKVSDLNTASQGIHLHSGWYLRLLLAVLASSVKFIVIKLPKLLYPSLLVFLCIKVHLNDTKSNLETNMSSDTTVLHKTLPLTHDLPLPIGPFVGREKVLSNVSQWLRKDNVMIIAIFGPPAIGKSLLSIHIGYSMLRQNVSVRYIDTVEHEFFSNRFMESPESDQHTLLNTISSQLMAQTWQFMLQLYNSARMVDPFNLEGVTDTSASNPRPKKWGKLRTWAKLLTNSTLLILDNCDNVLNSDVDFQDFLQLLEDLVQLSNFNLKVLLTSQIEIKLLNNFVPVHLEGLHPNDSIKLLDQLVQDYGVHVKREHAQRIAELVENIPLALKVVGSILQKQESSDKLVHVLEQELLKTVSDRDKKKDNFTAIMDIAYGHLNFEGQSCSHFLSLVTHSFDKSAAKKILNGCDIECADCCINMLVKHSLIEEYWYGYEIRLKFYRLIQDYFLVKSSLKDLQSTKDCFKNSYFEYYSIFFTSLATLWSAGELSEEQMHKFHSESHNMEFLINMYEGAGFLTSDAMPELEHASIQSRVIVAVVFIFSLNPSRALSSRLLFEFNVGFWDIYDQVGSQTTIVMYLELIRYHCRESKHCCNFWIDIEEHFYKYRLILEAEAAGKLSVFSEQYDPEIIQLLRTLFAHYNSCFGATTAFSVVYIAFFVLRFKSTQHSICSISSMIVVISIVCSIEAGGCDQELLCSTPINCYSYLAPQLSVFYTTITYLLGVLVFFMSIIFLIQEFCN